MSSVCKGVDCTRSATRRGMCNKHYMRWLINGNCEIVNESGRKRTENSIIAYRTMHHRLRKDKGYASWFTCEHCSELADEWAYTHNCLDERLNSTGNAFCHHLEHYISLCLSCHKIFDKVY